MKQFILLFTGILRLIFVSPSLSAQVADETAGHGMADNSQKFYIVGQLQDMKSTHNTFFRGGSLIADYALSHTFLLGIGTEYSYGPFHHDNASDLTNLRFLPVFVDSRLLLRHEHKLVPFVRLSAGITFASYTNKELQTERPPYQVKESGLYLHTGIGCSYRISKFFTPFIELGLTGFHVSFNNLDVNPHGLVLSMGFIF
jgi:hypothetical protein